MTGTVHANSPRDALSRLETLSLMSGIELPIRVIREQIASAVDVIVQQTRLRDGSRKVTSITEVLGMEGDIIVMSELFTFVEQSTGRQGEVAGELQPTGIRPMFDDRLEYAGFKLSARIFGAGTLTMRQTATSRRCIARCPRALLCFKGGGRFIGSG